MVTSGGNTGSQHWIGSVDEAHAVPLQLDRDTTVFVTWDQFDDCGRTDLDAVVLDEEGLVVGISRDEQRSGADRCEPVERIRTSVDGPQTVFLDVRHRHGPTDGLRVQVITRAGRVAGPAQGGTTDPAAHPRAVAVGAIPVGDYFTAGPERFSAGGLTPAASSSPTWWLRIG